MAKRHLPEPVSKNEIEKILAAALSAVNDAKTPKKQWCSWRDFVMIQTGLYAGPRVAELCALKVIDVDLGSGAQLAIKEGKGDKDRNVPIGNKLMPILTEWIGERKDGWLFPGPRGKQLVTRTFQKRLETLAKKAGLRKSIHPHMLRHAFATSLLRKKVNLRVIQQLLGHSSVAVTEIYTHVDVSALKEACDLLD